MTCWWAVRLHTTIRTSPHHDYGLLARSEAKPRAELLSDACLSDVTDDEADSPRSAVSVREAHQQAGAEASAASAAAAAEPVSRPVAHHIHFWEHMSPGKGGDGLSRAHSAPVAIRRVQQAPGRQDCHDRRQVHRRPAKLHRCRHETLPGPHH